MYLTCKLGYFFFFKKLNETMFLSIRNFVDFIQFKERERKKYWFWLEMCLLFLVELFFDQGLAYCVSYCYRLPLKHSKNKIAFSFSNQSIHNWNRTHISFVILFETKQSIHLCIYSRRKCNSLHNKPHRAQRRNRFSLCDFCIKWIKTKTRTDNSTNIQNGRGRERKTQPTPSKN